LAQSKLWKAGTLCITIAANIADTAILGIDACFPDSVIGFIPSPGKADARFIKYLFDALLKKRFQKFTQGAAQDNLSQEKLLSLKFPTPDLRTQTRIADTLSTYDDLIENNRRRIQLLEQSARLLYKEWFIRLRFPGHEHVKIKDGVPEGWESKTVNELSSYLNRGITPKYDEDSACMVINQKCIRDRLINLELARRQSKEVPQEKFVKFGDVLVNSTGEGTLGRVAQLSSELENCTVDSHITIVRPTKGIPVFYFGLYLISLESYFSTMGRGATNQTELSRSTIGDIKILVPAPTVVKEFEGLVGPIYQQVNKLIVQNKKLTEARDLLLPRLMNGEIEV
jgi:type I restriction enzyme S subunit